MLPEKRLEVAEERYKHEIKFGEWSFHQYLHTKTLLLTRSAEFHGNTVIICHRFARRESDDEVILSYQAGV